MKKLLLCIVTGCCIFSASAQSPKTELYDFLKIFMYDSTGYENVGNWNIGSKSKFPVKWKTDRIEMSDDTAINFFRSGTADLLVNGKTLTKANIPAKWNLMLKGPRMGYMSLSMVSGPADNFQPKFTIDSLFGKRKFTAKLLKSCDSKALAGYYYYEVKLPKKDLAYIKFSWLSVNGNTAIRIDCYDSWSKYAVKLDCPK